MKGKGHRSADTGQHLSKPTVYNSILSLLGDIGVLSACVKIETLDAQKYNKTC